jgi:hypothetical protein
MLHVYPPKLCFIVRKNKCVHTYVRLYAWAFPIFTRRSVRFYCRKWFQMAAWICSHKFCDNYNNRDAWQLLFLAAFIPAFCNLSGKWCSSDRYVWCDDQQVSMFPGAISTKELEANFEEYKDKNLIAYWYHAHSLHKPICSFCKQFSGRVPVGKHNTSMLATAQ